MNKNIMEHDVNGFVKRTISKDTAQDTRTEMSAVLRDLSGKRNEYASLRGRNMNANDVISYCLEQFDGTVLRESWGERGIFYNPNGQLARGVYVLTVKEKDGENDRSSMLNRVNTFRVNVGLRKNTFIERFGYIPTRPTAGGIVSMDFDFTAQDTIMPHPVYAWMGWVCVLNPTEKTFREFETMIRESYEYAKEKYLKRPAGK